MLYTANGRKVADGTSAELERQGLDNPRFLVSVKVNGHDPLTLASELRKVDGAAHVLPLDTADGVARFSVESAGNADITDGIFRLASTQGWALRELRRDVMDLEKIFHKLTQY